MDEEGYSDEFSDDVSEAVYVGMEEAYVGPEDRRDGFEHTPQELSEIKAAADAARKLFRVPPAKAKGPMKLGAFQFPKEDGIPELSSVPLCVVSDRWSRAELRSMDARPIEGRPELGPVRSLNTVRRYGHGNAVGFAQEICCACAWSLDGSTIAFAQVHGVSLWDVRSGRPAREGLLRNTLHPPIEKPELRIFGHERGRLRSQGLPDENDISVLSFSCDGSLLACLPSKHLLVWDLESEGPDHPVGLEIRVPKQPLGLLPFLYNKKPHHLRPELLISSVEFSPATLNTLAASHSFGVSLYQIARDKAGSRLGAAHRLHVPNAHYEKSLMAMEESTQEDSVRGSFECFLPGMQLWLSWAPDGQSLAVCCETQKEQPNAGYQYRLQKDLSVNVIDARTGALVSTIGHLGERLARNAVSWSPDSNKIAIYRYCLEDYPNAPQAAANTPFDIIEVYAAASGQKLLSLGAPKERLLPTLQLNPMPWSRSRDSCSMAWAPDDSAIVASVRGGLLMLDPKEPDQAGEFQSLPPAGKYYRNHVKMLAFAPAWQLPSSTRLALAMSQHVRLGRKSGLGRLGVDTLKLVVSMCDVVTRRPWSAEPLWSGSGKVRWQKEQKLREKTELEHVLEKDKKLKKEPELALAVRLDNQKPFCRVKEQTRISLHVEKHILAMGEGVTKATICALLGKNSSSNTTGWIAYKLSGLLKYDPEVKNLYILGDNFAAMRRHLKISRCPDASCAYCKDYFGSFVEPGGELTKKWGKKALQEAAELYEGAHACTLYLNRLEGKGIEGVQKLRKKTLKLASAFAKRHGKGTKIVLTHDENKGWPGLS